jgi:hypothetical protein
MSMINKPFFNALHYPSLMPFKKASSDLPPVKMPNMNVNQEVFNRLYDQALVDLNTKQMIKDMQNQSSSNLVYMNKNTGGVEFDPGMRLDGGESYKKSRAGSAVKPLGSAKNVNKSSSNDINYLKPKTGPTSHIGPRIVTRSSRL